MADGVRTINRFWKEWSVRDNGKEPTYPPLNGEAILGRVCSTQAGSWKKNKRCGMERGLFSSYPGHVPTLHIRTWRDNPHDTSRPHAPRTVHTVAERQPLTHAHLLAFAWCR